MSPVHKECWQGKGMRAGIVLSSLIPSQDPGLGTLETDPGSNDCPQSSPHRGSFQGCAPSRVRSQTPTQSCSLR